jgi:hypothetical protein
MITILILLTTFAAAAERLPEVEVTDQVRPTGMVVHKICLEGHTYYKVRNIYGATLAIKLDKAGKPVPCVSYPPTCTKSTFWDCERWHDAQKSVD